MPAGPSANGAQPWQPKQLPMLPMIQPSYSLVVKTLKAASEDLGLPHGYKTTDDFRRLAISPLLVLIGGQVVTTPETLSLHEVVGLVFATEEAANELIKMLEPHSGNGPIVEVFFLEQSRPPRQITIGCGHEIVRDLEHMILSEGGVPLQTLRDGQLLEPSDLLLDGTTINAIVDLIIRRQRL